MSFGFATSVNRTTSNQIHPRYRRLFDFWTHQDPTGVLFNSPKFTRLNRTRLAPEAMSNPLSFTRQQRIPSRIGNKLCITSSNLPKTLGHGEYKEANTLAPEISAFFIMQAQENQTGNMEAEDEIQNTQDASAPVTNAAVAALVSDSLKQQAAQFEAIINGLRTQLNDFKDLGNQSGRKQNATPKSATPKSTPDTSSTRNRMKPTPSSSRNSYSTPTPSSKAPRKSKTPSTPNEAPAPSPSRKRHPLQLIGSETPADYKTTRDALYIHIKMLWGLFKAHDVPPPPDPSLLKELYARFSSAEQVEAAITDPHSCDLVAQNDILTLRSLKAGGGKIGRGMANLDETYILYIHGVLAKVGIRVWCPDLNDSVDSLYNSACRITALGTFRQLMATGAYDHANVNPNYVNAMSRFITTYNHYVHYLVANRSKIEAKEAGKSQADGARKCIQKRREQLCELRMSFLNGPNRKSFPPRYRKICEKVLAHSDDEEVPGKPYLVIKTLPYRSKNASKFFRRLDIEMKKAAEIAGETFHKKPRRLPSKPVPSIFKKAPKNLPIDFYDPKWYHSLHPGQQRLVAKQDQVALLPDAAESLCPQRHPDEKLGDAAFNDKYLDILSIPYVPDDDHEDEADYVGDDDVDLGDDEDLEDENMDSDDESDFLSDGDFGNLYDDDEDAA
ncbi:uncharacterized protein MELLADRAFT_90027 [Melampsora larici-populina 98AG31]|uniref:Uncharacterized protein n=1 Tax=Melampsora larici-populina (strain 98AG31 / pathotype 3-4-7) TaxID=747676 RepID=F4RVG8_MELLP|nr:uncharacterized protein MELLADRAFT_90027 [Melampsora larici-populina 98AG31]EGG03672.1 hypothetical protein MELLADRAFT_90027 [Melampsora larici-populina 98AG31]